jgi:hypothetical protein
MSIFKQPKGYKRTGVIHNLSTPESSQKIDWKSIATEPQKIRWSHVMNPNSWIDDELKPIPTTTFTMPARTTDRKLYIESIEGLQPFDVWIINETREQLLILTINPNNSSIHVDREYLQNEHAKPIKKGYHLTVIASHTIREK